MKNRKNHKGVFVLFSGILSVGMFAVYAVTLVFGQEIISQDKVASVDNSLVPSCGVAAGGSFTEKPETNLCLNGYVQDMKLETSLWRWKCVSETSSLNATSISCSAAYVPRSAAIDGECGTANGAYFFSAPSENLCVSGERTSFISNVDGSWTWSCRGLNEGLTANCMAKKKIEENQSYIMPDFLNEITGNLKGKIIAPQNYAVITDKKLIIEVAVENASLVEFYIKRTGLSQEIYLGKGFNVDNQTWRLEKDISNTIPNGSYSLIARISNQNGSIESDVVYFKINLLGTENSSEGSGDTYNKIAAETAVNAGREDVGNYEESQLAKDSDQDNLSDEEESRIGTDPFKPDTDNDGYLDGDEIKTGYDPLKFSSGNGSDKIIFQNPKEKGVMDEKYKVDSVELLESSENRAQSGSDAEKLLRLMGRAIPNAFVTLYVYSNDPIVVIIKTDANGNWLYDLDKDLEDGDHEAYIAITDNTGKITAKSEPLYFVKTAEAANVISNAQADERMKIISSESPIENSRGNFIAIAIAIAVVFVSVALALIGMVTYKHREQ